MPGKHMKIDSLNTLIAAVKKYQVELSMNRKILENAANVCDAAMGSDDIVSDYIADLNEALSILQKTIQLASDVEADLTADRDLALDILYER